MSEKRIRITMKLKKPNPLFEKWITEWRDKAREQNSRMEFCFDRALTSLSKYPLPLERGRDCKILIGFGDKICQMLDRKLIKHKENQGSNLDDTMIGVHTIQDGIDLGIDVGIKKDKTKYLKSLADKSEAASSSRQIETKQDSSKGYTPKEGSGPYTILVTLYKKSLEPSYPGYLSKLEIVKAYHSPDISFCSMKTLILKQLVKKKGNPAKFSLTDEGLVLARKLYNKGNSTDSDNHALISNDFDVQSNCVVIDLSDEELTVKTKRQTSNTNSILPLSFERSDDRNVSQDDNYKRLQRYASGSSITSREKDLEELWNNELQAKKTSSSLATTSSVTSLVRSSSEEIVVHRSRSSKTFQKYTSSSAITSSVQSSQDETVIFLPNTFNIILYVDTGETGGSNVDIQDDPILSELTALSTPHEVKKLNVGDYTWVCRDRTTKNELILPYIIERKRMDDFGSSIKDGRYHEQKFRLKKSGIQNVTYLIENYGKNEHVGLPLTTLLQAATNTAVHDGFCIKFTRNYKDTAKYLSNFSSLLIKMFKSKTLVSCRKENLSEISLDDDLISLMTFKEFNKSSAKNKPMKVSDIFVKMLVQIKGISVDKALAIIREYPTPEILRKAYDANPGPKGEKLLAQIQFGDSKKTIGQALSKTIYQLFTMQSF